MQGKMFNEFFAATTEAFLFLEQQYGYQRQEGFVESPEDGRDTVARIRYVGLRVGIEIAWYFGEASISVSLIEFLQPGVFPSRSSYYLLEWPDVAKAIDLQTLIDMQGHQNDPDFLLQHMGKARTLSKRWKLIETRLPEILAGLAHATYIYATAILQGDTKIFPEVMSYYTSKQKRLYPNRYRPFLDERL